ncbi:MAG TPA: CBS domain-containing protein [Pseudogracilibacillus sp.]|nr:CBS domain-containing protein [Pseudogracilibacillus sp.]
MLIKDIMTTEVITVSEGDTVEKCAKLLSNHHLSGLPVVDGQDNVIGIITEGDLMKHNTEVEVPAFLEILGGIIYLNNPNKYFEDVKKSMGRFVQTVMTEEVVTIGENEKVEVAAEMLTHKKIKRLPVLNGEGKLTGIVAREDVLNHLFAGE